MRRAIMVAVGALVVAIAICSVAPAATSSAAPDSADPVALADDLVAAEQTLHDASSSDAALSDAAHRQQAAYRALGKHPEWDPVVRPRIPAPLLDGYDRNVDARRQLTALVASAATPALPAWRIVAPAPADELLGYYRDAEASTGVGWNYLAAINLIETTFGRVVGASSADARGPMQFLPATFAHYGDGDISAPRDAIMAAGRLLAANGYAADPGRAVYAYNHSDRYVRAVSDYAAVMGSDPAAFAGYHRWDVYYRTTSGDVLLPIGYAETAPIPVAQYLVDHPQ